MRRFDGGAPANELFWAYDIAYSLDDARSKLASAIVERAGLQLPSRPETIEVVIAVANACAASLHFSRQVSHFVAYLDAVTVAGLTNEAWVVEQVIAAVDLGILASEQFRDQGEQALAIEDPRVIDRVLLCWWAGIGTMAEDVMSALGEA